MSLIRLPIIGWQTQFVFSVRHFIFENSFNLSKKPRRGVGTKYSTGHIRADAVQLLYLSLPNLQKAAP